MYQDDPDDRNGQLVYSTAYSVDPRRQPIIGHMELFNLVTHEDMVSYHRSRYTTDNVFLSISGDFNKQEMLNLLEKITQNINRSFTQQAQVASSQP